MNEDEAVRDVSMNGMFEHLRKQDKAIEAIRKDIEFVVVISQNLEGFSKFCCRWGARLNRVMRWAATILAPIVTVYALFKDAIDAFFKRWLG